MALNRAALAVTLIYVVVVAAAFFAAIDIEPDASLLEEGGHASNVTAPFSILWTAFLSVLGVELFESSIWAYIIWLTSAAANTVIIYMFSKRTVEMLEGRPQAKTATQS